MSCLKKKKQPHTSAQESEGLKNSDTISGSEHEGSLCQAGAELVSFRRQVGLRLQWPLPVEHVPQFW